MTNKAPGISTTALGRIASDFEEVPVSTIGGDWRMAWHPADQAPAGQPHGINAFCVTARGCVVLVSTDGSHWGWPGARPGRGQSWEDALRCELAEGAGATVNDARLLGFVRSHCSSGPEQGLVLVRAIWRAEVTLRQWRPGREIPFRRMVLAQDLARCLWMGDGAAPIYSRAAREAALG